MSDTVSEVVFSGGHLATISYLGCIQKLIEKENFDVTRIHRWNCTSAGCIIALLLTMGYLPSELIKILKEIPFKKISPIDSNTWLNFFDEIGLHNTDKVVDIIAHFMEHKSIDRDITFNEYFKLKKTELIFMTFCLNTSSLTEFNKDTSPNMKLRDALRMAIAAPFIFKPVEYQNQLYIDAVILSNCPASMCRVPEKTYVFRISKNEQYYNTIDFFTYSKILLKSLITKIEDMEKNISSQNKSPFCRVFKVLCDFELNETLDICSIELEKLYYCGYNTIQ